MLLLYMIVHECIHSCIIEQRNPESSSSVLTLMLFLSRCNNYFTNIFDTRPELEFLQQVIL